MRLYRRIRDVPVKLRGGVAIKLHMGDEGTITHPSPRDVGILVERIKSSGGDPFLIDTPVLYPGRRSTPRGYLQVAAKNGFGDFEVVISKDYERVKGVEVAKDILEADSLLVLTHATGHVSLGFGGAIKNLGMGGVSRREKRKIHAPNRPEHDSSMCNACGACVEACVFGFLRLEGRLRRKLKDCPACERCLRACKTGALRRPKDGRSKTFELLTRAAKAVISPFDRSEISYITVLKDITEFCDCGKDHGSIICGDIGYLTGEDPLGLDVETFRLIRERNPGALDLELWSEFEAVAKGFWPFLQGVRCDKIIKNSGQ